MSLLLDALKKAAEEKKKNGESPEDAAELETAQQPGAEPELELEQQVPEEEVDLALTQDEESLDLDLEIEEPDSIEEEFPEVDDSLDISPEKVEDIPAEDEPVEEIDSTSLSTEAELETEGTEAEALIVEEPQATEITPEEPAEPGPEVEIPTLEKQPQQVVEAKAATTPGSGIQKEKALEALIAKSNQSTRSNKLKTNISIILIILIVLIFAAGYYFIEVTSSTQELFIADNQAINTVERNQEAVAPVQQQPAPVVKPVAKPAPVQPLVSAQPKKQSVKSAPKPVPQKPKKINIVRKSVEDPIDVLLRQAYNAFRNEDYRYSNELYMKVIDRDANNRDALLGLAAIGIKESRYEYSRQKYLQLLNLNPKDSIARAGLSTIESRIDPQLNESQLKFMLREQPDAAHLYFALGSLYANQEKWPEAQSAFFSAWSAENKNADYCYSLAVSLDHLGKKKQAKDFYQLSIKLKQSSGGNFSVEDTQNRIRFLQDSDS